MKFRKNLVSDIYQSKAKRAYDVTKSRQENDRLAEKAGAGPLQAHGRRWHSFAEMADARKDKQS